MKKLVCLVLVLCCVFSISATAFALTGKVVVDDDQILNLRKSASKTATIIGYIPNGSAVEILDDGATTNGFYHITAPCYLYGQTKEDCVNRTGYGLKQYIK